MIIQFSMGPELCHNCFQFWSGNCM